MIEPETTVKLWVPAPRERVFSAWTEPDELQLWYPDRVEGRFREGEAVHLYWDALGVSIDLEVAELRPPERLVLRGAPPGRPPQTQVVTLAEVRGGTEIAIDHSGFARADERDGTLAGWRTQLAVLRLYLQRHQGRSRRSFAAIGPAVTDLPRLFSHYTQPEQLGRWLAGAPAPPGSVGTACALTLEPGVSLSGEVVARTEDRELAMSADEIEGALAFRGFSIDGQDPGPKMIGVVGWSWSDDEVLVRRAREALARAVDRLVAALGGRGGSA